MYTAKRPSTSFQYAHAVSHHRQVVRTDNEGYSLIVLRCLPGKHSDDPQDIVTGMDYDSVRVSHRDCIIVLCSPEQCLVYFGISQLTNSLATSYISNPDRSHITSKLQRHQWCIQCLPLRLLRSTQTQNMQNQKFHRLHRNLSFNLSSQWHSPSFSPKHRWYSPSFILRNPCPRTSYK